MSPWDESHPKRYRRRTTTRVEGDLEDALSLWLLMPAGIIIAMVIVIAKGMPW